MSEETTKNIILTGGGTGGHAVPLVGLYHELGGGQKHNFLWLGERDSIEENLAYENAIAFKDISTGKIRRYFDVRNFYEPLKNLTGIVESLYHIFSFKADIVFSKGGFVSLPVCIAAWILRKKIYIHESDSVMGLANKISSRLATKVFYSFPNEKTQSSRGATSKKHKKHIHTGHIVSPDLLEGIHDLTVEENERLSVLVIAGSQGSSAIFKNLLQILPDCKDINFDIILGEKNTEFREDFLKFVNVKVHDFLTQRQLGGVMKNTDIAITRGSSTLWELYYFGIHAIIIPHPATGGNHQYHNASYFNEKFGSDILNQEENLHLEMFRKLQAYKTLRKSGLNLDGFLDGIHNIQNEIA